jgi:hypothetical protein
LIVSPWQKMTSRERARSRVPRGELLLIDQAGDWLRQLEAALVLLKLAVEILAETTGIGEGKVLEALRDGAALIPPEQYEAAA